MRETDERFDLAVVGAGPGGCVAALAHAQRGERVALLEANPRASGRFAGEWLHPTGVNLLKELGVDLVSDCSYDSGRGFVLFPEDGSERIMLPYSGQESGQDVNHAGAESDPIRGFSGGHEALIERLRMAASEHPLVSYMPGTRVAECKPEGEGRLVITRARGAVQELRVKRVIGADGRASRMRKAAGLPGDRRKLSMMAGVELKGAELPAPGYGHVFLGGPGPILAYRIDDDLIRMCIDVPLGNPRDANSILESYGPVLPESLSDALADALRSKAPGWAINQSQPREAFGQPDMAMIGDAVGFVHPLTAAGMTHAFGDAVGLAKSTSFGEFVSERRKATRVSELLAGVLYEVLTENTASSAAIRQRTYRLWRTNSKERLRTMQYLSGEAGQTARFAKTFSHVAASALGGLTLSACLRGDFRGSASLLREARTRGQWLLGGVTGRRSSRASQETQGAQLDAPEESQSGATREGSTRRALVGVSAREAIDVGADALAAIQQEDGRFEGEVKWCPMLAAQYVLFCETIGLEISPEKKARLLRHFEQTRRSDGLWGLHELSGPYLFVTTLVYVASRLLGQSPDSPELQPAQKFILREDVLSIPSWGKYWLAMMGLYDWRGAPPVLPEAWVLPAWLPVHPSNFYCHTRLIYLAMSVVYARKLRAPSTERLSQIREEIYPEGMEGIDWDAARGRLRAGDLNTPPSPALKMLFRLLAFYEKHHSSRLRQWLMGDLDDRLHWELKATEHTSISPVSGFLNLLALHAGNPKDPAIAEGLKRMEIWVWDDPEHGTRIAGARSATWDTSFATQALAAAASVRSDRAAADQNISQATHFLAKQQMREVLPGYREAFRMDPRGGFCFAGHWQGWPVSDCTAEALEAMTSGEEAYSDSLSLGPEADEEAIRYILRCQNRDGGFGSYEAQRTRVNLEWLNPAEMFGESMTEHSYVECTASALAALCSFRKRSPDVLRAEVDQAALRAERRLRALQHADGSWRGVWGVHFFYGTLFAIRGLVAAGTTASDPALRRACEWIREQQLPDGGWGEHHSGCVSGEFVAQENSQVIQTSWALMALLEAHDPDWTAIARGAEFLMARQDESGQWPREEPAGLFFRSVLLDYELYRAYFPLWALALYEARRRSRSLMPGSDG